MSPGSFTFATDRSAAPVRIGIGIVLIALGLPLWVAAVVTVMRGFSAGSLCTGGVYKICRHPVYASWSVLIVPGIAVALGNWLALTIPLFMCAVLPRLVRAEENHLETKFGDEYRAYKNRIPRILPLGWLKK